MDTTNLTSDAEPGITFYYAVVRYQAPYALRSQSRIIANCQHRHQTREAAEKCGERILRGIKR